MAELLQFDPPRAFDAEHSELQQHTWCEPKLDGIRAIVQCLDGRVHITSKRRNKDGEYNPLNEQLPHLSRHPYLLYLASIGHSVFDGELMMPRTGSNSFGSTISVTGSNPDKAIAVQQEHGWLELTLFDVVRWIDSDTTEFKFKNRRHLLEDIFNEKDEHLVLIKGEHVGADERQSAFKRSLAEGYEGIVVKDLQATYFQRGAWGKLKASTTVDALVIGWKPGNGKYEGSLGALTVAVFDQATGELREIANVAPGTDAQRAELYKQLHGLNRAETIVQGIVVELEGQGWSPGYRIRHPRVLRYRTDRNDPNTVDFTSVKLV
jgi:bifunctional non-homologous end joining protein LigD